MVTAESNLVQTGASPGKTEIVSDSLAIGIVFAIVLTVVQRALGFLRGILFCRLMTDQQLGQWSLVFSFLMLLAPLAVLGLPGSFGRFVEHYLQKGQAASFIRRIANISAALTVLLAGSMYLAPAFYSQLMFRSSENLNIVHSMAYAIVFVAASNFLSSLMESLRQVRLATLMRFTQGVGFAVFGVLLVIGWQDAASAATIGFGTASLLACVPALWFLWNYRLALTDRGARLRHSDMWRRIAPFAIWLWASNLVWNLFEVADRYMLVHWSPLSASEAHGLVGQYHSGRVVPLLLVGVAVVLEGMLTPYMTVLWEKNRSDEAGRQVCLAMKLLAIGYTIGAVLILIASPLLFDVILQGKYDNGLAVLPLTLVYCSWFSLFLFGQIYLWVAEQGKYVFAVTATGLALNLILNACLIPAFGLWGAVWATSIATLFCLVMTHVSCHITGASIDFRVWCVSMIPLISLLPIAIALVMLLAVVAVVCATNWLLDEHDKALVLQQWSRLKARFQRSRP